MFQLNLTAAQLELIGAGLRAMQEQINALGVDVQKQLAEQQAKPQAEVASSTQAATP
jgi:hypothetical protein